jgi:hypothetical protein
MQGSVVGPSLPDADRGAVARDVIDNKLKRVTARRQHGQLEVYLVNANERRREAQIENIGLLTTDCERISRCYL